MNLLCVSSSSEGKEKIVTNTKFEKKLPVHKIILLTEQRLKILMKIQRSLPLSLKKSSKVECSSLFLYLFPSIFLSPQPSEKVEHRKNNSKVECSETGLENRA